MKTTHTPSTRRSAAIIAAASSAIAALLLLSGCMETTQTTSGQRYLERYAGATGGGPNGHATDIDRLVAETAAIEPTLRFPARIGLARIENGALVDVPAIEGDSWLQLRDKLGAGYGEFIPLNLFVAEMVFANSDLGSAPDSRLNAAINRIRLGAARQHLDAVLIYEVATSTQVKSTGFSIIDWTIVGAWARTNRAHAEGYATALLLDVRNGYPYGTAMATAQDERSAATFGSENRLARQKRTVTEQSVESLTGEVETMFEKLNTDLPTDA